MFFRIALLAGLTLAVAGRESPLVADPSFREGARRAAFDAVTGEPGKPAAPAAAVVGLLQDYLAQYRRYLTAPTGTADEAAARKLYTDLKARYEQARAAGTPLCATAMDSLQLYLQTYEAYLKAPTGSVDESIMKIAYGEARAEWERRKGEPLFADMMSAFESYLSAYERYLRAPTSSTEESLAKIIYPLFRDEVQNRVSRGERIFSTLESAQAAYRTAHQAYLSAPSGSTEESLAKLRRTEYERELRALGGQP
jgi:hypothetical protein